MGLRFRLIEDFPLDIGFGRLAGAVVSCILFSFAVGVGFGRLAVAVISFILLVSRSVLVSAASRPRCFRLFPVSCLVLVSAVSRLRWLRAWV